MKKTIAFLFVMIIFIASKNLHAQTNTFPSTGSVGIGTTSPSSSSLLEIKSTTKGLLIPRLTQTQKNAIASPVTGLLIYQTDNYPGFYYYDGNAWSIIGYWKRNGTSAFFNTGNVGFGTLVPAYKIDVKGGDINISSGNALRIGGTKVFGDDAPNQNLFVGDYADSALNGGYNNTAVGPLSMGQNTNGNYNTAVGANSLRQNTSGNSNVAVGEKAMYLTTASSYNVALGSGALYSNNYGGNNVAIGFQTLYNNANRDNVGIGYKALYSNTTGVDNVAIGSGTLQSATTGGGNVAIGYQSLYTNTAQNNIAVGLQSMYNNTTGDNNTSIGLIAMYKNTTGKSNTVVGSNALYANTTGNYNSAFGTDVLNYNTGGYDNTGMGDEALFYNTIGIFNTAIGNQALKSNTTGTDNVAVGFETLYGNSTGYSLTGLGDFANVSVDGLINSTAVGYGATLTASNQVRVGNSSVTSIGGQVGWTNLSDGRYKQNIKQNVPGLAFINKLQPITYTLNVNAIESKLHEGESKLKTRDGKSLPNPMDDPLLKEAAQEKSKIIYTGFVAQDVEKAAHSLNYDFSGVDKPKDENKSFYGLRYGDFVVPLVKAVQQLSKMNDAKDSAINELRSEVEILQSEMDDLKAMIGSGQLSVNSHQSTALSAALLQQNVPNPFSNSTSISYTLPQAYSSAHIIITDNKGVVLKQISLNAKGKGNVLVDASTLAAGAYQYSLYLNNKLIDTKKMLLLK